MAEAGGQRFLRLSRVVLCTRGVTPTNSAALSAFRFNVIDLWRRTLRRRSQKDGFTWERIIRLADHWLPKPLIRHPWPSARFAVKHPRWEPYALIGHVRNCAGGAG